MTRGILIRRIATVLVLAGLSGCADQPANQEQVQPLAAQNETVPTSEKAEIEEPAAEPLIPLPPEVAEMKAFRPWTGDLDGMIKRRLIRTLVVYNKTTYFIDNGQPRGVAYDAMKEFETTLNKKLKLGKLGVHVLFLPVSRDDLLPALAAGKGDIAIGGLTVTEERRKMVDFAEPIYANSSEIIVTGPGAPNITSVEDLSGQEVFVRKGGSKYESLQNLNARFKKEGKKEVVFRFVPDNFEDEDVLEMANAGLMKILVADRMTAEFWKQIFPDITLHPDVALRTGADIAWAIRKNSPRLKSELDAFIETHRKGTTFGNILFQKYLKSVKFVRNSTSEAELKKYAQLKEYFEKYGEKYAVDWILIAAQGYQESGLDQSVKSQVGAIGVMQLMPATGAEMKVGDVHQLESNIHAGVKYMRFMIDQYYKDEPMDLLNKMLFTFASYNAGPGRIRGLRKEAAKRGLDPNVWFNNVERVVAEKVGQETVTYVSNIYKYYVAYTLVREQNLERERVKKEISRK